MIKGSAIISLPNNGDISTKNIDDSPKGLKPGDVVGVIFEVRNYLHGAGQVFVEDPQKEGVLRGKISINSKEEDEKKRKRKCKKGSPSAIISFTRENSDGDSEVHSLSVAGKLDERISDGDVVYFIPTMRTTRVAIAVTLTEK